ncbi:sulfiredoxin [Rhodotorula toruloides]|uniref:Sulfiredoxin n=1 Tax=Rhodotorula toruloides TaxID=5286 RepID=A0A511KDC7_RHOTO|nr:sulfiredoxin [Rhodotorula toruloides]
MTEAQTAPAAQHVDFSKFATPDSPTVNVPLEVINRPVPSQLEEEKVLRFMEDIKKGDDFTPIEVLRCAAPDGQKYYFAFGGCHRYEAHKRLKSKTIPGRIINVPPSAIRMYLGASAPF